MSEEYQDGCMVISQVIAALQLAIERYGDLPVTYADYEWGDSQVRFVSLEKEENSIRGDNLPKRILISRWPSDGKIITRAKKTSEV